MGSEAEVGRIMGCPVQVAMVRCGVGVRAPEKLDGCGLVSRVWRVVYVRIAAGGLVRLGAIAGVERSFVSAVCVCVWLKRRQSVVCCMCVA